jgi:hypothetical protein
MMASRADAPSQRCKPQALSQILLPGHCFSVKKLACNCTLILSVSAIWAIFQRQAVLEFDSTACRAACRQTASGLPHPVTSPQNSGPSTNRGNSPPAIAWPRCG